MKFIILGIIGIGYHLISQVHGCNHQLLKLETEAYHQRIWSNFSSSQPMIKGSLAFFDDPKKTPPQSLEVLKNKAKIINQRYFLEFTQNCENIFKECTNNMDKIAVYILFENVMNKSLEHLEYIEQVEQLKQSRTLAIKQEANSLIESLLKQSDLRTAVKLFKIFHHNREFLREQIEKSEEGIFKYMTSPLLRTVEDLTPNDCFKYLKIYAYKYGALEQRAGILDENEKAIVMKLIEKAGQKGAEFADKYIDLRVSKTKILFTEKNTSIPISSPSNIKPLASLIKEKLEPDNSASGNSFSNDQDEKLNTQQRLEIIEKNKREEINIIRNSSGIEDSYEVKSNVQKATALRDKIFEYKDLEDVLTYFNLFYNKAPGLEELEKSKQQVFEPFITELHATYEELDADDSLQYLKVCTYYNGAYGRKTQFIENDLPIITALIEQAGEEGHAFAREYIDLTPREDEIVITIDTQNLKDKPY